MSDIILSKPLSILKTGVREEATAAAVIELDKYTIKTIFGDGTVLFEQLDPKSRMYVPDSIDFDTTEKMMIMWKKKI